MGLKGRFVVIYIVSAHERVKRSHSLHKTYSVQQVKETENLNAQEFCIKMLHWFSIQFLSLAPLVTISGTGSVRQHVAACPICMHQEVARAVIQLWYLTVFYTESR